MDTARAGIRAKVDRGDVARVDVTAEDGDAGRRLVAAADRSQELREMAERALVRGPVLEVHGAPEPFAQTLRERTPRAIADGLVPRLEVVDARWQEDRQRRRQYQVVESTAGVLGDPLPFLLVDHVSSPLDGDARRARVAPITATGPSSAKSISSASSGGDRFPMCW